MFLPDSEMDRDVLLQGDIIKNIPLLAVLEIDKVIEVGQSWGYANPLKYSFCAVVSHSCEIAEENGVKVTSCILAPVRGADGATTDAMFEDLKRGNELVSGSGNYLKYFYLEPNGALPAFARGSIVDFSKIFSLRKTSIPQLIQNKILQMSSEAALQLARKSAYYFYRGKD